MRIPGLRLEGDGRRLEWRATRVPGVSWIPLHLEQEPSTGPRRGGAAVLIRMEPGAGYAPHRHLGVEDVLVLGGGYRDEFGEYHRGEHVHYEAGSAHAPRALGDPGRPVDASNPACILYSCVPGGIELLDPAGAGGATEPIEQP